MIEEETEVLQSNIPERIQLIYGSKPPKVSEDELEIEAKWITKKLERKKKYNFDPSSDPLTKQVHLALYHMKIEHFEVKFCESLF